MKKILWIVAGVLLAGTIALAISVSDDENEDNRGQDLCLCDFFIVSSLPHTPGTCKVVFGAKHLENSDACCNHDAKDVRIAVNSPTYQPMIPGLTEGDPCHKQNFTSVTYYLPSGVEASWSVLCSGHGTCALSGSITPYCD